MARRPRNEMEFGSDSFLDIIANIVGILIILIVIAGLRAARAPATPVVAAELPKKPVPAAPKPAPAPKPQPEVIVELDVPSPPRPDLRPPTPDPSPELRDDLLPRIAQLQGRIKSLSAEIASLKSRLDTTRIAARTVGLSLSNMSETLRNQTTANQREHDRLAALETQAKRGRRQLAELRRQYDEAGRKGAKVTTVRHRLTPVGEQVSGKELHFRIADGKVALVPIDDLVIRMRDEVLRRKSWLIKFPTHKGTVGPIGGFEMDYAVTRQLASTIDELRGGYGRIKIVLQGWKISPTSELEAESADVALRPGSKFQQEIRFAPNTATVTFWVYPDSFTAFRKLQAAVHREGLRVAARPLPFGVPIAGSPNGSRSSGQ